MSQLRARNDGHHFHLEKEEEKVLNHFFPEGVIVLDLETTGLSPLMDQIVEIAAFKWKKGKLDFFSKLVNPKRVIPEKVIKIHGITNEMVKECPTLIEVLPEFNEFCEGLPQVAHNAQFDIGFLVHGNRSLGIPLPEGKVYCTVKFSRKAYPLRSGHGLSQLCEELKIVLENHHAALDDAFACLKVLAIILNRLSKENGANGERKILAALDEANLFNLEDFKLSPKSFEDLPLHLSTLPKWVEDEKIIELKYRGGSMKNKFRPVKLIGMIPLPHGDMLYGHCLKTDLFKYYSIKKISAIRELSSGELQEVKESLLKKDWGKK